MTSSKKAIDHRPQLGQRGNRRRGSPPFSVSALEDPLAALLERAASAFSAGVLHRLAWKAEPA